MAMAVTYLNNEEVGVDNEKQWCKVAEDRVDYDVRAVGERFVEVVSSTGSHVAFWYVSDY